MGCGCGGGPRLTVKWQVTFSDGRVEKFLTPEEAEAARTAAGLPEESVQRITE